MSACHPLFWMLALGIAVLEAGLVHAQNYPNRPIRFVTTGVGASTDFAARTVAQGLTENLGWQVVVDNRGSTILACDIVAKAAPDGYTVLVMTDGLWRGPLLQKMPFDPVKDFAPVTLVSRSPNILVVHPSVPAKSVKELIALAKAKPGQLNYGAGAIGASTHLAAELFKLMAGVDIVHVPYKSSGQALTALLGAQLHLVFSTTGGVTPHINAGRLRALAVSTSEPTPLAPGLPTVAEAGNLPGYESASTAGVFLPVGASKALTSRLHEEITRVITTSAVKERFFNQGVEVMGTTPEQAAAFVRSDMAMTAKVIKAANIPTER
jgi:tripartite-type tricarboxylate transporter receptor subunit TctC